MGWTSTIVNFFVAESAAILKTGRHLAFAQSSFMESSCHTQIDAKLSRTKRGKIDFLDRFSKGKKIKAVELVFSDEFFNKKRFGFLKSNVNKRFWTTDQLTNQQRICKEATASKHVLYTISTIHFLLSDSLNKYEEHLEGWRCTLKILNFQGHF